MKTSQAAPAEAAAVVQIASRGSASDDAASAAPGDPLARARAFAEPLLAGQLLDTGEDVLVHADGVAGVLAGIGAAPALRAAAYLVYTGDYLQRPEEVLKKAFGPSYASLAMLTRQLVQIQRAARAAQVGPGQLALHTERVRKMLLAFSRDLRVVLLRLASRLQTLRYFADSGQPCPGALAQESLQIFAPLANRLGIWQIKWELEDLAFRFTQPAEYQRVARLVDGSRAERERGVAAVRDELAALLAGAGLTADVHGRPKHLYSIWKKMQGKGLAFARVFDARALRVIVADVPACYTALARVHERWRMLADEFTDYIARPKPNGYQSLHTVVLGDDGRPLEVQIRTRAMHAHAEHGVAAHWMYKEVHKEGTAIFEERIAEARKAVLRELLAWERDTTESERAAAARAAGPSAFDDRIYVFTPEATIIDLPVGGTPVDFAYALHTELGHRCRGARVDGALVPLNTALASGQTVEVVAAKEGGPSLDWLNAELGYLRSPRARAKVRAWFNAQAMSETVARGREAVEKLLQREGRTALERDRLAEQLGFKDAGALYEVVGKDEYSLRNIEQFLRPVPAAPAEEQIPLHRPRHAGGRGGGVLVVGVDSLLTTLARCCRPAPPDPIAGFVTRGKGVAIHRAGCSNLRHMAAQQPGRVTEVQWGARDAERGAVYPLDVVVEASDRPGLLRDISDVFAKDKINVTGVNTTSARDRGTAWMTFTVEVPDTGRLSAVLAQVARVAGVRHARRR
jgi:GTP pyrophosphokinase